MHSLISNSLKFCWMMLKHLLIIAMSIIFPLAVILLVAMSFQPNFQIEIFVGSTVITSSLIFSATAALLVCPFEVGFFRHEQISLSTLWFSVLIPGAAALFASIWGALIFLHEHLNEYQIIAPFGAADNVVVTVTLLCFSLLLSAVGSTVCMLPDQKGDKS